MDTPITGTKAERSFIGNRMRCPKGRHSSAAAVPVVSKAPSSKAKGK